MKTYYKRNKFITISWLSKKYFNKNSLCSKDYRELLTLNKNLFPLSDFITSKSVWKEIGSESYMKKSKHRFLKTVNISDWFLLDEARVEYCKPENKIFPQKWDILIVKDGWWNWLWEIWYYNLDNENNYDSLSSWLIRVTIKKEKKFYILGLLKSQHFKNYIDLNTAQGSTIRHSKRIAIDYRIPFPSKNNHQEPEKIENLVSLITQNLIDKEEQIKLKNKIIDEKIEKELRENQISWKYEYYFPTISWIRETSRLDTWLYWQKFKEFYSLVENYKYWYWNIEELWFKTKKWPNLAISVIWTSIYSDEKINKNFKQLILSKDVTEEWWIKKIKYIWNKKNLPTLKQYDFMLFARWDIGRVLFIDDSLVWATSNFDVFFITSKLPYFKNIFLLNYFKFLKIHNFWEYFWVWGSWAPSLTDYFLKKLKIPKFPEEKQQEIATLYYNKVEKNTDLTFENYLEKEKERNSKLWIFQLNMELFELRETLENLIDKIIMDKKIEIDFDY